MIQPIRQTELELYKEYPYIAAWNNYLHRHSFYIIQQIRWAKEEAAPADSIYRDDTGRWVTFEGCKNQDAVIFMGKYVSILIQE